MDAKEKKRLYDIEYRKKNREKLKISKKEYYENNKAEILKKESLKRDSDEYRAKHAEYCRNPEQRKKEKKRRHIRENKLVKKFCVSCEKTKPIIEFIASSVFPDGRRHVCNDCENELKQKYGYTTKLTLIAMKSRRYTNLEFKDFAKYPYLIEANKYLILLKQITK